MLGSFHYQLDTAKSHQGRKSLNFNRPLSISVEIVLIDDWCERSKPTVGRAILWQVSLGCIRKLAKLEPVSRHNNGIRPCLLLPVPALSLGPFPWASDCDQKVYDEINPFLPLVAFGQCLVTAPESRWTVIFSECNFEASFPMIPPHPPLFQYPFSCLTNLCAFLVAMKVSKPQASYRAAVLVLVKWDVVQTLWRTVCGSW